MKTLGKEKLLWDALELFRASPDHLKYSAEDIHKYLVVPIEYNTLRIYYRGNKPVGLVTWCWLDEEHEKLFLNDKYHPTGQDHIYDSNKKLWGMEFIAPYGDTKQVFKLIKEECVETYGPTNVNFRRFHSRTKIRTKRFK
jgi:hemolysin-activating ACP:hemolysin acyltransferase